MDTDLNNCEPKSQQCPLDLPLQCPLDLPQQCPIRSLSLDSCSDKKITDEMTVHANPFRNNTEFIPLETGASLKNSVIPSDKGGLITDNSEQCLSKKLTPVDDFDIFVSPSLSECKCPIGVEEKPQPTLAKDGVSTFDEENKYTCKEKKPASEIEMKGVDGSKNIEYNHSVGTTEACKGYLVPARAYLIQNSFWMSNQISTMEVMSMNEDVGSKFDIRLQNTAKEVVSMSKDIKRSISDSSIAAGNNETNTKSKKRKKSETIHPSQYDCGIHMQNILMKSSSLPSNELAIVPNNYPYLKMCNQQANLLEIAMIKAFKCIENGIFRNYVHWYMNDGAFIVSCANETTQNWVMGVIPIIKPWKNAKLLVGEKDLILKTKVSFKTSLAYSMEDPSKIFELLQQHNCNLKTSNWQILNCKKNQTGKVITVFIDESSKRFIEAADMQLYLGKEKVTFKIISKKNKK